MPPEHPWRFLTGLGMIVSCFRADLAYAYSVVAQSMATPTKKAYEQLRWVVRYLKGTVNLAAFSPANQGGAVECYYCRRSRATTAQKGPNYEILIINSVTFPSHQYQKRVISPSDQSQV